MRGKLWFKLGAPIIAISMVAACGTGTNKEPVKNEVPIKDEAPLEQDGNNNQAPVEEHNLDHGELDGQNPVDEEVPQDNLDGTNKDKNDENR